MRVQTRLFTAGVLLLGACALAAQDKATKEAATKLHDGAAAISDQAEAVKQLCKAAAMWPGNKQFVADCNQAKVSVVDGDKRSLRKAQDLADSGNTKGAKSYADQVSDLDPGTYQKAKDLIARLTAPQAPQAPPTPKGPDNAALLTKAQNAFESGDIQTARSTAQQVTDGTANYLMSQIDKYSNLVKEGQREESSSPNQAISSYQSALVLNAKVAGDDLRGRIDRLQKQVAVANEPPKPQPQPQPQSQPQQPAQPKPAVNQTTAKAPEPSPEDKKKKLTDAYNLAMARKDLEGAQRSLQQILTLDPRDVNAKNQLKDIQDQVSAALSRDPAKLESTLKEALVAFYASDFDSAESKLNVYLRASGAKKKGAAYFYLGATEQSEAFLQVASKRVNRMEEAKDNFKQARQAGYQPVQKYVSEKILQAWQQAGT